MSVACGHTAAACRAINARCESPYPSLQGPDGRMGAEVVAVGDPTFRRMLSDGWKWTVIKEKAAAKWPWLPKVAQRALNASNSIFNQISELEFMVTVADMAETFPDTEWKEIVEIVADTCPQDIVAYKEVLGKFAKLYAGGASGQLVRFADGFAKQFSENTKLGEDYLTAVVELKLGSAITLFPYLRCALLCANLISTKVVLVCKYRTKKQIQLNKYMKRWWTV